MSIVGWRVWVRRVFAPTPRRAYPRRLWLELLEARVVPSTFYVTNTGDTGSGAYNSGDLRYCIAQASDDSSGDVIDFSLLGAGAQIIHLNSALQITGKITVDGTTHLGYAGQPLVTIDGGGLGFDGFDLSASAAGTTIQGLAIDNCYIGVRVDGADNTTIQGNYIGVAADGVTAAGNSQQGVRLQAASCTVSDNVISGNQQTGLWVLGDNSNTQDAGDDAANNNVIEGNKIGTDADGITAVPNDNQGLLIQSDTLPVASNEILNNTIASNNGSGLVLNGPYFQGTTVQGNAIVGNRDFNGSPGDGVRLEGGASYNLIGGDAPGTGNVIAFNAKGVVVVDSAAENAILGNSIYGNVGPGVDLGDDGPTPNSPTGAPASGPNDAANYPVVASVTPVAGGVEVAGSLTAFASTTYRIEVFASPGGDPYQGESFLGSVTVATDATGAATFDSEVASPPAGWQIDATATVVYTGEGTAYGDTSEFSPGVSVPAPTPTPAPTVSFDPILPAAAGARLQATGHIADPDGSAWAVSVDYGDGTRASFSTTNQIISLQHIYAQEGSYVITVVVTDEAGVSSTPTTAQAEVFVAGTDPALVNVCESDNGRTNVAVAPGVTALFTHYGPDPAYLLVTPLPPTTPSALTLFSTGPDGVINAVSYDVRGVNIGPQDTAVVQFSYPADDVAPQLFYFDRTAGKFRPLPSIINAATHTILVVFDQSSALPVTDLNGTVFTITASPIVLPLPSNTGNIGEAAVFTSSTGGQNGATGGVSLGGVFAAAVGALTVSTVAVGDGGGGGDDSAVDAPTAVQEILGDLPAATTPAGDAGTPPGTAVLSPSQATLPDGPADKKDSGRPHKRKPAPGGPGALRVRPGAPSAVPRAADGPTVASTAPGAVQRPVAASAVDLALAVGLPFVVVGRRRRAGERQRVPRKRPEA